VRGREGKEMDRRKGKGRDEKKNEEM